MTGSRRVASDAIRRAWIVALALCVAWWPASGLHADCTTFCAAPTILEAFEVGNVTGDTRQFLFAARSGLRQARPPRGQLHPRRPHLRSPQPDWLRDHCGLGVAVPDERQRKLLSGDLRLLGEANGRADCTSGSECRTWSFTWDDGDLERIDYPDGTAQEFLYESHQGSMTRRDLVGTASTSREVEAA